MQLSELVTLLKKECNSRTDEDVNALFYYLRGLDCMSALPDTAMVRLCQLIRHETHHSGTVLYRSGEKADCWYILIKGNIIIDGIMFVPPSSFGKRVKGSTRRQTDCLVLDDSEFIVIDYRSASQDGPDVAEQQKSGRLFGLVATNNEGREDGDEFLKPTTERWIIRRSTDNGSLCVSNEMPYQTAKHSSSTKSLGEDSCGIYDYLKEASVDSDIEDGSAEAFSPVLVKDAVKDCLDKHSKDRTDDDIEVILDFMQHFPAFSNMTFAMRQSICSVVAYAVIESANTTIYTDGQEFDSWSVIINGEVEVIKPDGNIVQLNVGDSFGLQPVVSQTVDGLNHSGRMYTKVDNCQFVCVAKEDFYKILMQGMENTEKLEEHGKVVMVTEKRPTRKGNKHGNVIIRSTPEKLLALLMEDQLSVDPTYAEDFLLTSRTFLKSQLELADRLLAWLNSELPPMREKAVRIILLWVNNHFSDFEFEPCLNDFLAKFEIFLISQSMEGQLKLLSIACSVKSHLRRVHLSCTNASEEWPFTIFSGSEINGSIFVGNVTQDIYKFTKNEKEMLLRGDQILKVNGYSFETMSCQQACDFLKSALKLDMSVQFNIDAFREVISAAYHGLKPTSLSRGTWKRNSFGNDRVKPGNGNATGITGAALQYLPKKLTKVIDSRSRNKGSHQATNSADFSSDLPDSRFKEGRTLHSSGSHPDLTAFGAIFGATDQLIKIHLMKQPSKNLLINKDMTVAQVVAMAVKECGLQNSSRYCLCVDTPDEPRLTLQNHLTNVASTVQRPNSKLYLMCRPNSADVSASGEDFWLNTYQSDLLHLPPEELAKQLTSRDIQIFKEIESTEYVVDLFGLQSNYGTPNLSRFTKVVNEEMFWVITEICIEGNVENRAKLIQKFIKIAKVCKEASNFNSMFFIISGLSHGAISRLKLTWERVPTKYNKLLKSMQDLLDPSRNMSNYRNLMNSQLSYSPAIPFFPIVKKDLTFIHLGNDSKVEGLVNFEKLRMVAKEVRRVSNMASSYFHTFSQQNLPNQSNSSSSSGAVLSHSSPGSGASMFATLRKKKPLPARLNSRRLLLDETQLIKRVSNYLSNMRIIDDEDKLIELSNLLEPPANPKWKPVSPLPPVIDAGVPNVEAKQNVSGQKFGTSSTQAVQKLMSLTDKVKPHDHKKNPVPTDVHLPVDFSSRSSQPKPWHQMPVNLSMESSSVVGLGLSTTSLAKAPTHYADVSNVGGGSRPQPRHTRQLSHGTVTETQSLTDNAKLTPGVATAKPQQFARLSYDETDRSKVKADLIKVAASPDEIYSQRFSGQPTSAPVSPIHTSHRAVDLYSQLASDDSSINFKQMPKKLSKTGVDKYDNLSDEELLVSIV